MNTSSFPQFVPELEPSSLLGDLARPVFHDCNDFLNNLLLQLVLMAEALPETMRSDLVQLGQRARNVAAQIREWQRFRKADWQPGSTDLNVAIADAVREAERDRALPAGTIKLRLAAGSAIIPSPPGALRRLCFFLLADALGSAESVEVASERSKNGLLLWIDDNRPEVADAELNGWFEPRGTSDASRPKLEIAVCASLAQRCAAAIRARRSALGGVRVDVAFAANA